MKVGERGQITIPKHLRERYGLQKNIEVEFIPEKGGIRIQKRTRGRHPVEQIRGIAKLRYANTVDEYVEEIRGK